MEAGEAAASSLLNSDTCVQDPANSSCTWAGCARTQTSTYHECASNTDKVLQLWGQSKHQCIAVAFREKETCNFFSVVCNLVCTVMSCILVQNTAEIIR